VLVVVTDSYMGIFLPSDLNTRLSDFINKKREFPFIEKDEIIGTYYLFGKNQKLGNHWTYYQFIVLQKKQWNKH